MCRSTTCGSYSNESDSKQWLRLPERDPHPHQHKLYLREKKEKKGEQKGQSKNRFTPREIEDHRC